MKDEGLGALEAKIDGVARENKRLRIGLGLLLSVMAGLALLGQAALERKVEANEFVLKDRNGQPRALLFVSPEGSVYLSFLENGKSRAILGLDKGRGPFLSFSDRHGPRLSLDASAGGSALALFDENGRNRFSLGFT